MPFGAFMRYLTPTESSSHSPSSHSSSLAAVAGMGAAVGSALGVGVFVSAAGWASAAGASAEGASATAKGGAPLASGASAVTSAAGSFGAGVALEMKLAASGFSAGAPFSAFAEASRTFSRTCCEIDFPITPQQERASISDALSWDRRGLPAPTSALVMLLATSHLRSPPFNRIHLLHRVRQFSHHPPSASRKYRALFCRNRK